MPGISQCRSGIGTMRGTARLGFFFLPASLSLRLIAVGQEDLLGKNGLVYADLGMVRWQNGAVKRPICCSADTQLGRGTRRRCCCWPPVKAQIRGEAREGCPCFPHPGQHGGRPWGGAGEGESRVWGSISRYWLVFPLCCLGARRLRGTCRTACTSTCHGTISPAVPGSRILCKPAHVHCVDPRGTGPGSAVARERVPRQHTVDRDPLPPAIRWACLVSCCREDTKNTQDEHR